MYEVVVDGVRGVANFGKIGGETVMGRVGLKTPFLTAARKILEMGGKEDDWLQLRWAGSPTVCMTGKLGKLAALTVIENENHGPRFGKYRPFSIPGGFPVLGNRFEE